MVCEDWIPRLIPYATCNNILGTLIQHTQLFMNIDAMV
jgi:hypothetical protein